MNNVEKIISRIKAAEDRAQRALELGNEVGHRIHTEAADSLRQELKGR